METLGYGSDGLWHDRVVPETDQEFTAAAKKFLSVTGWPYSPKQALEFLRPWFERGWPVAAILYGHDKTYDGERQRTYRHESLENQFNRRMKDGWVDGLKNRRPTPIEPISRENLAASQLRRWHEEFGDRRPTTEQSDEARKHVRKIVDGPAENKRTDQVERARESGRRMTRALDSLGPGARLYEPESVFAEEIERAGILRNSHQYREALRVSGLDKTSANEYLLGDEAARKVLRNKLRRFKSARSRFRVDELLPPPDSSDS